MHSIFYFSALIPQNGVFIYHFSPTYSPQSALNVPQRHKPLAWRSMVNVLALAHFNSMLSQTEFSLIKNKEKLYLNLEKKKKQIHFPS